MEENYILTVTGKQTVDGNSDKIELQTAASYVMKNGSRYITYREYYSQNPEKKYRTTVKVDPNNVVTVMKGGTESHHLMLEQGVRHKCEYVTPYGIISLGIYSESVNIDLDDHGGELSVSYTIDIESQLASSNELYLKIEEVNNNVNG